MQITVQCPLCGTEAQLDDSLMGRKLRCANQECRRTFRVTPDGEALPVVDKPEQAPIQEAMDWQSAPPPMAGEEHAGYEAAWTDAAPPPAQADWEPPPGYSPTGDAPVFQPEGAQAYAAEGYAEGYAQEQPAAYGYGYGEGYGEYTQYRRRSNKGLRIILGLLILGVIGVIVMAILFVGGSRRAREEAEQKALKSFNAREWHEAKSQYEQLKQKFPDAAANQYDYYLERCQIEIDAKEGASDPKKLQDTVKALEEFIAKWSSQANKELYEKRGNEIWLVAITLAKNTLDTAKGRGDKPPDPSLLPVAETAVKIARAHEREAVPTERDKEMKSLQDKQLLTQRVVQITQDRARFQASVQSVGQSRSIPRVDELYELRRSLELKYEPLQGDAELKKYLDGLFAGMTQALANLRVQEKEWVGYSSDTVPAEQRMPVNEGLSFVASPALLTPEGKAAPAKEEDIVLAVARGTLYGLSAVNGEARWAMRIGIDTQSLPARAEVRPDQPDLAFVTAQDAQGQHTINCVDVKTGKIVWARRLEFPSPAGPSLIGGRLYVPLLNGRLEIIDTADGTLLGSFDFRLRLTVSPAWDKSTNRLFVAGEQNRIFVLQLDPPAPQRPRCIEVIHTGHRAGSIRGGLVVAQGLLVFAEAVSVDAMQVRAFSIKDPQQTAPLDLDAQQRRADRIPGLAAYAPRQDDDTIAFLSDKGYFVLYATSRNLSADEKPLALLSNGALGVPWPAGTDPNSIQPVGPAQIVDVQLNDWSMLIGPWLYRKRFDPYRKDLVTGDTPRLLLGTPLHAAAISPDSRLVITVTLLGSRVQATALNRVTGAVVWQRQLGLLLTQEPARLEQQVLTLDRSGTLGRISGIPTVDKETQWLPLDDWPALPKQQLLSRLVVSPNNQVAVSYAYNPNTRQLLLRQVGKAGGPAQEQTIPLASQPWGEAALSDDGVLMLPCRDGNLREFTVARSVSTVALNWRSPSARANSRGYAVFLSPRQVVATDGHRRLLRWNRGEDNTWRQVDAIEVASASHFVTPLAVVKPNNTVTQIAAGDDKGTVHLVAVIGSQSQQQLAEGGLVAQGPVVLGPKRLAWVRNVGEGQQLVIWEAGSDQPGRYPSAPTPDQFVGLPQAIGDLILVAEQGAQGGRVTWLQMGGTPVGQIAFTRNLTPTAGGVALDAKRALVPLSDGTLRVVDIPQK